jgi:hypothetical protein
MRWKNPVLKNTVWNILNNSINTDITIVLIFVFTRDSFSSWYNVYVYLSKARLLKENKITIIIIIIIIVTVYL